MSESSPPSIDALLAALERELTRPGTEGELTGSTPSACSAWPAPRPRARRGLSLARASPLPGLPEDFLQALEADGGQYRGKPLPGVRELDLQQPGIVSLISDRSPEPGWVGGSLLGFKDEETCVFHGELLHVDPDDSRVFAQSTRELTSEDEVLAAERWVFRPFDFSQAARDASGAYSARGPRLAEALEGVEGALPVAVPDRRSGHRGQGPLRGLGAALGLSLGPTGNGQDRGRGAPDGRRADPRIPGCVCWRWPPPTARRTRWPSAWPACWTARGRWSTAASAASTAVAWAWAPR